MELAGIYILGMQRSGETWLARLLAEHDEIYAVKKQTPEGKKPQESYYFSHFIHRFPSKQIRSAYCQYWTAFADSAYCLNSGVDANYFTHHPVYDPYCFFHEFMRHAAISHNKRLYLEKTQDNTPSIHKLNAKIKNIVFIYVKRDLIKLVNSSLNRSDLLEKHISWNRALRIRSLAVLFETAVFDKIACRYLSNHSNLMVLAYEDLIANREASLQTVMAFVGLPYQEGLGSQLTEPVPTEKQPASRFSLSKKAAALYRLFYRLVQALPMFLVKAGYSIYWKTIKQRYGNLNYRK